MKPFGSIPAGWWKIVAPGCGAGAAFSLLAALSFGDASAANAGLALALGAFEGLLITGAGTAVRLVLPKLTTGRAARMSAVALASAGVHAILAAGLLLGGGVNVFMMTGVVALLSVLVGEWVYARDCALAAGGEAAPRSGAPSGLPSGLAERLGLSPREAEVAALVFARAAYKEIGEQLFISVPTVKSHVSSIYRKAGVGDKRAFIALVNRSRASPAQITAVSGTAPPGRAGGTRSGSPRQSS